MSWSDFVERSLPLTILLVALVSVPVLVLKPEGLPRMRALEKELTDVQAENAETRREIIRLRADVEALRDDPRAVERISRDQLGLLRKSEIVFHFGNIAK
jgi:cell division protein FtsB